jgi:signal transduction histidine kinase
MVRGAGAAGSGVDGLGIGLDTCRRIVHAHQGSIGVGESAEGGAEFWFALPEPGDG